jgi:hypothetical protein
MTTTLVELTHAVQVVTDQHDTYRAECSCDWTGEWQPDELTAELAGTDHVEVEVGPADPLDRLMSGLLGLQEDLAVVVIWLADNWTADLPAPTPWSPGYGKYDTLALAVHCSDLDGLYEVAGVLGEPVIRNASCDQSTGRFWHAVRSFGRVSIEAWGLDR